MYSRDELRQIDRICVEKYAIPSILLMENAARGLASVCLERAQAGVDRPPTVLVICGKGNNGGDGLAAARHLHNHGLRIRLVLPARDDEYAGDAAVNLAIARKMNLSAVTIAGADPRPVLEALRETDGRPSLVVDALFGTGLAGPVTGPHAAMIAAVNAMKDDGAVVVSADLPSGLDADTGEPLAEGGRAQDRAVRADVTVSFVGLKRGFLTLAAQPFLGDVTVFGIGAPRELVDSLGQSLSTEPHPGDSFDPPAQHRLDPPGSRGR